MADILPTVIRRMIAEIVPTSIAENHELMEKLYQSVASLYPQLFANNQFQAFLEAINVAEQTLPPHHEVLDDVGDLRRTTWRWEVYLLYDAIDEVYHIQDVIAQGTTPFNMGTLGDFMNQL